VFVQVSYPNDLTEYLVQFHRSTAETTTCKNVRKLFSKEATDLLKDKAPVDVVKSGIQEAQPHHQSTYLRYHSHFLLVNPIVLVIKAKELMPDPICLLWTRISEVFDTNEILVMENLCRMSFNFPAFSRLEICEDVGIMIGKCEDRVFIVTTCLIASGYVCELQDYNPDFVSQTAGEIAN